MDRSSRSHAEHISSDDGRGRSRTDRAVGVRDRRPHCRRQHTPLARWGRSIVRYGEGTSFPPAAYSEWSAILQNVLLNAANATLDATSPKVEISSMLHNRYGYLYVSDNGVGIGDHPEELFKPFARKSNISADRRELGMGGRVSASRSWK
ncbi:ATP-binding protein [Sphingomonas sp. 7/4-4]|uniref:ATP-binding protein n=1 Tax=Sphingomonas sp. 7/4-4 TaxID=3018446 RepID=UPI003FA74AA4